MPAGGGVIVAVLVGVGAGVFDAVPVGVGVSVGVLVMVLVGDGVFVGVGVRMAETNSEYNNRLGDPVPGLLTVFKVAFDTKACNTVAGDAVGLADKYKATTPATCGDAMEVPPAVAVA